MNNIYETGDFPLGWKTGMLHMIHKGKGDKRDPANCRRISLLSTLSKVVCRGVLARRLEDWREDWTTGQRREVSFQNNTRWNLEKE
jgi:hypothetical protein